MDKDVKVVPWKCPQCKQTIRVVGVKGTEYHLQYRCPKRQQLKSKNIKDRYK